jgi:CubicO group peptidase (beta-lactamase class C family)
MAPVAIPAFRDGLERCVVEAALQKVVDAGQLAEAATLVWRDGEAQTACVGWRDIEAKLPVERDTIFRIATMTKPITSVAALLWVEEGRITLIDSIARYAPGFSHMRVLRSPNGPPRRNESGGTPYYL